MCGRFELITSFDKLPKVLKQDYPIGLDSKYEIQNLIRPTDPVLVVKNEGKMKTTFMYWGFINPWAKDPFDKNRPRPFNARSETVEEKKLFSGSWKHRRCLIPASGFLEKKYRIRKENNETFWLGGIWSKWTSSDGAQIESCCVLTTKPNQLIKPIHHRMPVVVPNGYEKKWTEQVKDSNELKGLASIMMGWSPEGWLSEEVNKRKNEQISLF
jgi:putative SOS response-associated peptidase YedK|tara:strand:- start:45 stop:683 length:639 start_codon:yes stop_codon:yes gene_type:complete